MNIQSLVTIILFFMSPIGASESDSLFLRSISRVLNSRHKCMYDRIIRASSPLINKHDTLLLVPSIALYNGILWDYDMPQNNALYADWKYFDTRPNNVEIVAYIRLQNDSLEYYSNIGLKRPLFVKETEKQSLLSLIYDIHPQRIFCISGVPGWFLVINERIIAVDVRYDETITYEDPLCYIKYCFTEKLFMPIFSLPTSMCRPIPPKWIKYEARQIKLNRKTFSIP